MIILRNKTFGKYDEELANKMKISKEKLRGLRRGFVPQGNVNDIINTNAANPYYPAGQEFKTTRHFRSDKFYYDWGRSEGRDKKEAYKHAVDNSGELLKSLKEDVERRHSKYVADRKNKRIEELLHRNKRLATTTKKLKEALNAQQVQPKPEEISKIKKISSGIAKLIKKVK